MDMYFYDDPYISPIPHQEKTHLRFSTNFRHHEIAKYFVAFKLRNPAMWAMWYRFRLMATLTEEERVGILPSMEILERSRSYIPCKMSPLDEYALHNPFWFLFVDAYQFGKKALTKISQVIRRISRDNAGGMTGIEYVCQLKNKEGLPEFFTGALRESTNEEETQAKRRLMKIFELDCKKILTIFDKFWSECTEMSESEKSAFLKCEILQAYPDFLTNSKREDHVLTLMDWLMQEGHRILEKPNRRYLKSKSTLLYEATTDDLFDAWVASDPDTWFTSMCLKYGNAEVRMWQERCERRKLLS